jgi:predicted  nucleic acid-binding Zn-ribbon protein
MPEKIQPQTFPVEINELNRRVRMIEIKMDKIEERLLELEKAVEQLQDDLRIIKDLNDRKILELKNEMSDLNDKIEAVIKKSEQFVTKIEFQKIKTFIDIVNPLTSNFVTKDELESTINELKKSVLKEENKI